MREGGGARTAKERGERRAGEGRGGEGRGGEGTEGGEEGGKEGGREGGRGERERGRELILIERFLLNGGCRIRIQHCIPGSQPWDALESRLQMNACKGRLACIARADWGGYVSERAGKPTSNAQSPNRHPATTPALAARYCSGNAQLRKHNEVRPVRRRRNPSGCVGGPAIAACQFSGLVARSLAVCAYDGTALPVLGKVTRSHQRQLGLTATALTCPPLTH